MNILDEIAARARRRVEEKKKIFPIEVIRRKAEEMNPETDFPFEKALRGDGLSLICEVKRASPSKGVIAESFPYVQIAKEYEAAGADAVSVLTEPDFFKGSDEYLREISKAVSVPLLRKDFTVDDYMIYEAKLLGAGAVLLICAILSDKELAGYMQTARALGLSALVEAHDEEEVDRALHAGAGIIGVNNRDLKTFAVDIHTSERLRSLVPRDKIFVSESGIQTPADLERLRAIGAHAALIGEAFMRSADKAAALKRLRGERLD